MVLTTTDDIAGATITNYLGVVSSTTYVNTYDTKDLSFKDMFKKSKLNENAKKAMEEAKENAFQELKTNAMNLKANAIVGISLDIEHIANTASWGITIVGTAVTAS